MQHIGSQGSQMLADPQEGEQIGRAELAVDREPRNAKLERGRDCSQSRFGPRPAGRAVADDADVVAARGLAAGDVEDVPEDSADRGARHVHDPERLMSVHDQNQRSLTVMMSPGRTGVRIGMVRRTGTPSILRVTMALSLKPRGVKPPAMATAFSTVMSGT